MDEVTILALLSVVGVFAYILWGAVRNTEERRKTAAEFRQRPLWSTLIFGLAVCIIGACLGAIFQSQILAGWSAAGAIACGGIAVAIGVARGDIILFKKRNHPTPPRN